MGKVELVISHLGLSNETKAIQDEMVAIEIGQSVEYNGKVYTKTHKDLCEVEYSNDWKAYKFEGQEVGSYVVEKKVTANEIESVIVGAFEGGSNYWLGLNTETSIWQKRPNDIPYSTWATQMLLEGETLDFYDIEEEEETWTLTLEQLVNGFKLNAIKRPFDSDVVNGDAITSDCILQYGMFGKLVYG